MPLAQPVATPTAMAGYLKGYKEAGISVIQRESIHFVLIIESLEF
jgi:hypothetical protein